MKKPTPSRGQLWGCETTNTSFYYYILEGPENFKVAQFYVQWRQGFKGLDVFAEGTAPDKWKRGIDFYYDSPESERDLVRQVFKVVEPR